MKTLRIHVTHTDLDGAGCAVVFLRAFGGTDKFYTVNHDRIDSVVRQVLHQDIGLSPLTFAGPSTGQAWEDIAKAKDAHGKIVLWITDIAPSVAVMDDLLMLWEKELFDELLVCDHHKTSAHLCNGETVGGEYNDFVVYGDGICGAELVYHYADRKKLLSNLDSRLREFVAAVDAYDLWKLDSPRRERGENLNKLFRLYGIARFADIFCDDPERDKKKESAELIGVLEANQKKAIAACIRALKQDNASVLTDNCNRKFMYVFNNGDGVTSQLGQAMLDAFEDIDYAAVVSSNGVVSLRSRKGGTDVSSIAKRHPNGGGHANASGFKIETRAFYDFLLTKIL
ncbi:MAG: hypothetical protein DRJ03_12065 [Chloroflexi bacterium]|nr:MAG: hypothetical protein DRJ03_12065 [Chloroflexota bacterium]